jgi:Zn-dependent protease with chaperone function
MSTRESTRPTTSFVLRDPETFFHAQRRNRRATSRMSALAVFAAFLMGIPLTLALTPLFYAGTLVIGDLLDHFHMLPPGFLDQANALAVLAGRLGNYLFNHRGTIETQELVIGAALVLLPGMVIAFALWVSVLALFRRGGVGGAMTSLNAREPNQADLKELQLADTAQEMAIAAGLPAPKLMLVDSPGANAAAIGTSMSDARIVISRRLIDDLNRDQLQALLGHLIGSIGNGDLRVAFTVTSVFETCGLLLTLINSPFGSESRRALWRVVRYAFLRSGNKAAEADSVAEMLSGSIDMDSSDITRFFEDSRKKAGPIKKFFRLIFFPIFFTNISIELTLFFFLNILLGPCMALVWRTRRYLADASAVELTRNPDALAQALERLAQDNSSIPGGAWAAHLFVINPSGDHSLGGRQPSEEQMQQAVAMWSAAGGPAAGSAPADYAAIKREMMMTGMAAMRGDQAAAARMQSFVQAMAAAHGEDAASMHIPNLADLAAARQGDRAAIARLRALAQQRNVQQQASARSGNTGLQAKSFLSFHPPLKKRLKRLERMGAHLAADTRRKTTFGGRVVMAVLFLILAPLMAVAGGAMLVAVAMMIGLNLFFLALWLAAIHAIFVWWKSG